MDAIRLLWWGDERLAGKGPSCCKTQNQSFEYNRTASWIMAAGHYSFKILYFSRKTEKRISTAVTQQRASGGVKSHSSVLSSIHRHTIHNKQTQEERRELVGVTFRVFLFPKRTMRIVIRIDSLKYCLGCCVWRLLLLACWGVDFFVKVSSSGDCARS